MDNRNFEKSKTLFEKAKHGLVGGTASSLHKGSFQEFPIFMDRGEGSRIYDVDGNAYIDYMMAFGPMILGYCPKALDDAVIAQLKKGTQFAAPTESLVDLSDKLISIIPSAEKIGAFCGSGTDANTHAIRLSRAYTGKTKIIKFEGHYHGWLDELDVSIGASSPAELGPRNNPFRLRVAPGQVDPENVIIIPYNDIDLFEQTVKRQGNDIAAVILETIIFNNEPVLPAPGFLEAIREITKANDIMLIFDEIITGFRMALGGAQEYFGVTPDLSTFGKAMAGGYPMAVVVGREDVVSVGMDAIQGTFNGNPLSVAAALTTIGILEQPGCYEHMNNISQMLVDGITDLGKKYDIPLFCKALSSIWVLYFGTDQPLHDYRDHFDKVDKVMYKKLCAAALNEGLRLNPFRGRGYISTAHTETDIQETLDIFGRIFVTLKGKTA